MGDHLTLHSQEVAAQQQHVQAFTKRSLSRCIHAAKTTRSAQTYTLTESRLPLPFETIPASATNLSECALHQIQSLLAKEKAGTLLKSTNDEDCLDDGFFMCDLNVVRHKVQVWRHMFPAVHPFFAVKCNPDPMVAAVIGQLAGGFDCASVPEIELALASSFLASSTDDTTTATTTLPLSFLSSTTTTTTTTTQQQQQQRQLMIVYANPQRAEQHLDRALTLQIRALTFDGPEELYKIHRAYQKQLDHFYNTHARTTTTTTTTVPVADQPSPPPKPSMILRIVVPDQHSSVPLGEKFGASPDKIAALTELAMALALPIVGVSFHCGSGNHDPASYQQALELAYSAMQTIDHLQQAAAGVEQQQQQQDLEPCWLLDMGGGYPGVDGMGGDEGRFSGDAQVRIRLEEKDPADQETTAKIAQVVTPFLDQLLYSSNKGSDYYHHGEDDDSFKKPVLCISEPGRYFVEAAFALCSRIYRVRIESGGADQELPRRHYYIAQGVQGVFKDCLLCNETFVPIPLPLQEQQDNNNNNNTILVPSTVHGPSGEDYDVMCRDTPLPVLQVGDWLVFDRMGAYTLSIAARNGRTPVRYVLGATQLDTTPSLTT